MKKPIIFLCLCMIGLQTCINGMQHRTLQQRYAEEPRTVAAEHAQRIAQIKHEIDRQSNRVGVVAGLAGAVGMLFLTRNSFAGRRPFRRFATILGLSSGVAGVLGGASRYAARRLVQRGQIQDADRRADTIARRWAQANKETTISHEGEELPLIEADYLLHDKADAVLRQQIGLSREYDPYEVDAFMRIVDKMEDRKALAAERRSGRSCQ